MKHIVDGYDCMNYEGHVDCELREHYPVYKKMLPAPLQQCYYLQWPILRHIPFKKKSAKKKD